MNNPKSMIIELSSRIDTDCKKIEYLMRAAVHVYDNKETLKSEYKSIEDIEKHLQSKYKLIYSEISGVFQGYRLRCTDSDFVISRLFYGAGLISFHLYKALKDDATKEIQKEHQVKKELKVYLLEMIKHLKNLQTKETESQMKLSDLTDKEIKKQFGGKFLRKLRGY